MLAGTGVIFAAVYLLWMVQRVFFGKITNPKNKTLDRSELARDRVDGAAAFFDGLYGRLPEAVFESLEGSGRSDPGKSYGTGGRHDRECRSRRKPEASMKVSVLTILCCSLYCRLRFAAAQNFLRHDRSESFSRRPRQGISRSEGNASNGEDFAKFKGLKYFATDKNFGSRQNLKKSVGREIFS